MIVSTQRYIGLEICILFQGLKFLGIRLLDSSTKTTIILSQQQSDEQDQGLTNVQ